MLEEHPLDPSIHDRQAFDSGVPALDEYLRRFAEQHRRKGITAAYVLVDSAEPSVVLGYYTLSAAEVGVESLDDAERSRLPRYPIPCFRMGRLACRADRQGEGLGKMLIGCAVDRCLAVAKQVGAYALIVDAENDDAKAFYLHYGFKPLRDEPLTRYLPLRR